MACLKGMTMGCKAILNLLKAIAIFSLPLHLLNWSFSQNVVEKHFNSMVFLNISTESPVNGVIKRETATGFIVCDGGHILTNAHIIPTHEDGAYTDLSITGSVGRRDGHKNKISSSIRMDEHSDLMLLKFKGFPPSGIKVVRFANPEEVDVGADLYSLGYPFEEDIIAKFGKLNSTTVEGGWATSLGFDNGDSGGPVFNDNDHVVAVARAGQGNLKYAIPINDAANLLEHACGLEYEVITTPEDETITVIEDEATTVGGSSSEPEIVSPQVKCAKPTVPFPVFPEDQGIQPNHFYGEGDPWKFEWLASSCEGGLVEKYQLVVKSVNAARPAIDEIIEGTSYTDDTSGTISGQEWTWKVRAIDDQNQVSDWSEERFFVVPRWEAIIINPPKANIDGNTIKMEPGTGFIISSLEVTSGVGSDRDIWWNGYELVPGKRMCSIGKVTNISGVQNTSRTCVLKFDGFVPEKNEGFLLEIIRDNQKFYAAIHVSSIENRNVAFEWLYPVTL